MTVTRKDYLCLRNEEFLNDVIIDFYLKYLQHGFFINDPDVQVQHLSYFSIWKLQGVFFSLVPPKISKRPDWSPPFPLKSLSTGRLPFCKRTAQCALGSELQTVQCTHMDEEGSNVWTACRGVMLNCFYTH